MRSTIYLNHYPDAILRDREAVTVDLTASVSEMGYDRYRTGAFVSDLLNSLDIEQLPAPRPSDMLLIGSHEAILRNQQRLTCNIGRIADKAMQVEGRPRIHTLEAWGYKVATHTIPALAREKTPFISSVGRILKVIGEDLNDDGCDFERGLRPGWYHHIADKEKCWKDMGETFTLLMARIPEYIRGRSERLTHRERILLVRATDWLFVNAKRLPTTAEARFVEEFDTMVSTERDVIARVAELLRQRGLPEDFILAPDIWERLISERVPAEN